MVTIEDCVEAEELVKADKGIRALLKDRYGITDMSMVAADPWFYGDRYGKRLWSPSDLRLCTGISWAGECCMAKHFQGQSVLMQWLPCKLLSAVL